MDRLKKALLITFTFLVLVPTSKAATCGYEEKAKLNNEVANVKANYEIKERVLDRGEYSPPDGLESEEYVAKTDYIEVHILNITKNMYIVVTNDLNGESVTYGYDDANNGNISFTRTELDSLITYTIKVYASNQTGCEGSTLKTLYVSLPRYNDYSTYDICKELSDYYLCQRYVTYESVGYDTFFTRIREQLDKKEEDKKDNKEDSKWYEVVGDFISKHKVPFIIGGITLVVVAGGATIVIIKKRRRSII